MNVETAKSLMGQLVQLEFVHYNKPSTYTGFVTNVNQNHHMIGKTIETDETLTLKAVKLDSESGSTAPDQGLALQKITRFRVLDGRWEDCKEKEE